jgi:hypothetical protein
MLFSFAISRLHSKAYKPGALTPPPPSPPPPPPPPPLPPATARQETTNIKQRSVISQVRMALNAFTSQNYKRKIMAVQSVSVFFYILIDCGKIPCLKKKHAFHFRISDGDEERGHKGIC